ncbi:putative nuclease with TOPRIM domain [Bacilli bacterium PM5-3]|nr:putative nuclease with TOPRIM domain [Bacilli bacterium PM5-3]MDH6604083.1 putative nuclease with TOPRIM domain [Bacilli bacterium PM5-9]
MAKDRIKNEEIWQMMREEVIYVLQNNSDISNKEDLLDYFEKYHTQYNISIHDLDYIIAESSYINELLKKNYASQNEFKEKINNLFNEIIEEQINNNYDEPDELAITALYSLFEEVLNNEQLLALMKDNNKSYQEIVKTINK